MSFNLDEYVEVPERIRMFFEKYPEGSLQSEYERFPDGWLVTATAYRTPDDKRPGYGQAFEPVPGKTPYTRDSELMNAETSAWGRALVALGFVSKKVASKEEVRNRTAEPTPEPQSINAKQSDEPANEKAITTITSFADEQLTMGEARRLYEKLGALAAKEKAEATA